MVPALVARHRVSPPSSGTRAVTGCEGAHHGVHARQGALEGTLEHQGPTEVTPAQGTGQTTLCAETIAARRAGRVPHESWQGWE